MIFIAQVLPAQTLDKSRVTVTMENATVKQFLDEVERQTGIEFLYNADEVKNLRVTVRQTNAVARQVITQVMADIGCEIRENNGIVVVRQGNHAVGADTEGAERAGYFGGIGVNNLSDQDFISDRADRSLYHSGCLFR